MAKAQVFTPSSLRNSDPIAARAGKIDDGVSICRNLADDQNCDDYR
jgi:hypothetical protein